MELLNYASASEVIGQKVSDTLGHEYGTLKDILFSPKHQKAMIAVINTEGSSYITLPFEALRINPNTQHITVDIDKQTIRQAPQADLNLLREGRREEIDKIYTYYGYEQVGAEGNQEPEPLHQSYKSGENTGERHQESQGSYQESQQYPGSPGGGDADFKEEADYDKMKGLPKNKD